MQICFGDDIIRKNRGGKIMKKVKTSFICLTALLSICIFLNGCQSSQEDSNSTEINTTDSSTQAEITTKDTIPVTSEEFTPYQIKINASEINIYDGPGYRNNIVGKITDKGTYTIIEEAQESTGAIWGKLKSGAGWIDIEFAIMEGINLDNGYSDIYADDPYQYEDSYSYDEDNEIDDYYQYDDYNYYEPQTEKNQNSKSDTSSDATKEPSQNSSQSEEPVVISKVINGVTFNYQMSYSSSLKTVNFNIFDISYRNSLPEDKYYKGDMYDLDIEGEVLNYDNAVIFRCKGYDKNGYSKSGVHCGFYVEGKFKQNASYKQPKIQITDNSIVSVDIIMY